MKQQTHENEKKRKMFQNSRVWSRVRKKWRRRRTREKTRSLVYYLWSCVLGFWWGPPFECWWWKPYSFSSTGKWRIRTILLEKASIYHLVRCFEFNATVLRSSFLMWLNVIVMIRDLFKTWHVHTQQRRDGEWVLLALQTQHNNNIV